MTKEDKILSIIFIPIMLIGFIFIIIIGQKLNKDRYDSCINNGGKAIVNETGYFKNCVYGDWEEE